MCFFNPEEYLIFKSALHKISSGFTVSQVERSVNLFNLTKYFVPDILFINIPLLGDEAIDCIERLRSEKDFNSLPIVIYSTSEESAYLNDYCFSKNNYYMTKPFSFDNLCKMIEGSLSGDSKQLLSKATFFNQLTLVA